MTQDAGALLKLADLGTTNVTEKDREYAKDLLDDLGDDGITDLEIVAQWLRKVRVENVRSARQAASQGSAGGEAVAVAKIDLALKIVGEPASGHKMMSSRREAFAVHGLLKAAKAALSPPVKTGGEERSAVQSEKPNLEYVSDWARIIYDACGDQKKVDRAIELAHLNGMFDHLVAAQAAPDSYRDTVRQVTAAREKRLAQFREALESIAAWRNVNIQGEYEHGLRDIIRSVTDCAQAALEASPVPSADREAKEAELPYLKGGLDGY